MDQHRHSPKCRRPRFYDYRCLACVYLEQDPVSVARLFGHTNSNTIRLHLSAMGGGRCPKRVASKLSLTKISVNRLDNAGNDGKNRDKAGIG
jgi:hypothetical protein